MNQEQIEKSDNETARIYMNEETLHCPFCGYTIVVDKDTELEDVVCPECNSKISEYNEQSNSKFSGSV